MGIRDGLTERQKLHTRLDLIDHELLEIKTAEREAARAVTTGQCWAAYLRAKLKAERYGWIEDGDGESNG